MNSRNLIFAGAALLLFGLFTPIVTFPIVGAVNLFGNGGNVASIALLMLAIVSGGLALKDRSADALWPGVAALGVLIYCFARLQYGIGQMRASLRELDDNPFAGMVEGAVNTVQIQWGWLILFAGAALIIYAAWKSRPSGQMTLFAFSDSIAKGAVGAAAVGFLIAPALDLVNGVWSAPANGTGSAASAAQTAADDATRAAEDAIAAASGATARPSREEAAYISQHLQVYELEAKYFDSVLDGRVPGVTFKVKNNGGRTLTLVTVRVIFNDAEGRPIAEEEYSPVLVSPYSFGESNTPLRPNYIAQQDRGSFYTAKSVPSEWQSGQATATITEIEFAPDA